VTRRMSERYCAACGTKFQPKLSKSITCSKSCYGRWRTLSGSNDAQANYERISGDWEKYFSRLLTIKDRADTLTANDLIATLERQGGRCVLTGKELTCKLKRGKRYWTNASLDRIDGSRGYEPDNVQLVCIAVNLSRGGLTVDEYVKWCKLVAKYNEEKANG